MKFINQLSPLNLVLGQLEKLGNKLPITGTCEIFSVRRQKGCLVTLRSDNKIDKINFLLCNDGSRYTVAKCSLTKYFATNDKWHYEDKKVFLQNNARGVALYMLLEFIKTEPELIKMISNPIFTFE